MHKVDAVMTSFYPLLRHKQVPDQGFVFVPSARSSFFVLLLLELLFEFLLRRDKKALESNLLHVIRPSGIDIYTIQRQLGFQAFLFRFGKSFVRDSIQPRRTFQFTSSQAIVCTTSVSFSNPRVIPGVLFAEEMCCPLENRVQRYIFLFIYANKKII